MRFVDNRQDYKAWDYHWGDSNMCIATQRYFHLFKLSNLSESEMKFSFRDIETNKWTKWLNFFKIKVSDLQSAYDIHRSLLRNEVVIESDYPTYEENYDATRLIGAILEGKGFQPMYYYSGNKSLHIHIYFDFKSLLRLDKQVQDKILEKFSSKKRFITSFMKWLRTKMISCWGLGLRKFDDELINQTHLIRSEMSRNKKGYKTFVGYSYKDLSFVPYVCNETNRIYPQLGEIRLSQPYEIQEITEEYLTSLIKTKKRKASNGESLNKWLNSESNGIRPCVELMLYGTLNSAEDGTKRLMFVLANELKRSYGSNKAFEMLKIWNDKLDNPILESELEYRIYKNKEYTLNCGYISKLLKELGYGHLCENCKYKP